jgi:hypothetical protein
MLLFLGHPFAAEDTFIKTLAGMDMDKNHVKRREP